MERKTMTKEVKLDILDTKEAKTIKDYFIGHGWEERNCSHCESKFLAKPRNETKTCGRADCSNLDFLDRPKRKRFLATTDFVSRFEKFFSDLDYERSESVGIVNKIGSTLFVGTAGQIFDRAIFNEEEIDGKPRFVAQPVIRLQGRPLVGEKPGFSTSFVNIAIEQLNPTIEEHIKHLDDWLNFTSQTGLFMGEMTVRIVKDSPDWGGHNLDAITVKMYYGGLEIGVANWFVGIPQNSREFLRMSDISFGLERMVWVANKSKSYYDAIGPLNYSMKNDQKLMDSYRTAVLMALAGVEPDIKDRSSKLRALIKEISDPGQEIDRDLIVFYTNWWKKFASFEVPVEGVLQVIIKERNRNVNLGIKKELGVSDSIPLDISPIEYINKVIDFGIPFERVKEFLTISNKK